MESNGYFAPYLGVPPLLFAVYWLIHLAWILFFLSPIVSSSLRSFWFYGIFRTFVATQALIVRMARCKICKKVVEWQAKSLPVRSPFHPPFLRSCIWTLGFLRSSFSLGLVWPFPRSLFFFTWTKNFTHRERSQELPLLWVSFWRSQFFTIQRYFWLSMVYPGFSNVHNVLHVSASFHTPSFKKATFGSYC